ncbi:aldo/keto reductase [Streptomyces sp. 4N124]|uniref:aldo/keto reductase n=1 Tax=Streptomyces sp. 4N124 TaxID=3457420 RepID=UPI003FD113A0
MRTTTLGTNGPQVGVVGLGCMGISFSYDQATPRDQAEMVSVIHQALDLGMTLLDTSDVYGPYTNEQLVGRALADGHRDRAVLATKVGVLAKDGAVTGLDGRPEHIRRSIDESLGRLGTDHVDLYYLHRVDPDVPIEESVGALAEAVEAGKARAIGLSEVSVEQIKRAQSVHPVTAVQSELSLWTRDWMTEVLPYCGPGAAAGDHALAYLVSEVRAGEQALIHSVVDAPVRPEFRRELLELLDVPEGLSKSALERWRTPPRDTTGARVSLSDQGPPENRAAGWPPGIRRCRSAPARSRGRPDAGRRG